MSWIAMVLGLPHTFGKLSDISHFEVARYAGLRCCQSALRDCFVGRIFNMGGKFVSLKQSHNALSQPFRPGLPRNLKVANKYGQ